MKTEASTATTSGIVNSRFNGEPKRYEAKTSSGATKSAICKLDPRAIPRLKSILSRIAIKIAEECSALLPMMATTITPTKTSVSPKVFRASLTRLALSAFDSRTRARLFFHRTLVGWNFVNPPSAARLEFGSYRNQPRTRGKATGHQPKIKVFR